MAKTIKAADLAKRQSRGASVQRETRNVKLEGMDAMLAEVKKIAKANDQIAQKRHTDLIDAVNRLADVIAVKSVEAPDLAPLISAVLQGMNKPVERVPYVFSIERDELKLAHTITARPEIRKAH